MSTAAEQARYRAANKDLVNTNQRRNWSLNEQGRRRRRARELLSKYGLTPAALELMIDAQGRACALCKLAFPSLPANGEYGKNVVNVDHCHVTGRVRGALCNQYNTSLGRFGDDHVGLRQALDYVTPPVLPEGVEGYA